MAARASEHPAVLREAGVPEAASASLAAYLDLLVAWGRRVNLTAARSAEARVGVLVVPALRLQPLLVPGALLDVGSGNGSPGLVLALLDPGRPVTLLEPHARRWAFLREAARACGRPDIEVLRLRHDAYSGAPAANVTLRGLSLPAPAIARLIAVGGQAFVSAPMPGAAPLLSGRARVYRYRLGAVPRET